MAGVWHHNTTECMCHAVAKFVLHDQPPPRRDTPFWLVGGSYSQVCGTLWKEKLYGHGHIPKVEVDFDRIDWFKPNQGWPFRVPLKDWPGRPGKNWTLVFKSYDQGRAAMQAESIGGLAFSEQFEFSILEEVLRGCREYNFPGSKMIEFTPVDPSLSSELQEMIENGFAPKNRADRKNGARYLPDTWEIYRANTECAMEAGHISREWFHEFFGMVSDELLQTRLTGAWGTFEGLVYAGFNPAIHVVPDELVDHPPGVRYIRAIDWGAGPENPFACLWMYRDGVGIWTVFDEYYSTDQAKTPLDHLAEVKARHPWPTHSPFHGMTWCDPSNVGMRRIAQTMGFNIGGGRNAVFEGITCVQQKLQGNPALAHFDAAGKYVIPPMLRIHEGCRNLRREFQQYQWEKGGGGLNPKSPRAIPVKKNDHALDALRYGIYSEENWEASPPQAFEHEVDGGRFGINLSRGRI